MKPLDAGQQRELEFLRAQPSAWMNMRPFKRWVCVCAIAVVVGAVTGGLAALAGGPWLWLGLSAGLLALMMVGVSAVAPQRALEWAVRSRVPTQESMERCEKNRSWPG